MLEHLEEREGGDVDLLGGVEQRRVRRRRPHPGGAEDPLQPLHRRFRRRLDSLCALSSAGFVRSICLRLVRKSSRSLAVAAAAFNFFLRPHGLCPGPDRRGWASFGVGWAGFNWKQIIRAALQFGLTFARPRNKKPLWAVFTFVSRLFWAGLTTRQYIWVLTLPMKERIRQCPYSCYLFCIAAEDDQMKYSIEPNEIFN